MLRAIVAALLARSAIHAAGKLKKFSASAKAARATRHELMELLPPPDAKSLGGEALSEIDYARFLSVSRWKVDRAANMLRADLEWRCGRAAARTAKEEQKQLDRKRRRWCRAARRRGRRRQRLARHRAADEAAGCR